MSFFSGSQCCISPALAEKQRCYVVFHRSITEDRPVFFSWNAARVPACSLSCDMSFRWSGILWNGGSGGQEWLLSRRCPDDIRHRKITSSDIIITTKWHRNYHRMTDKLPEGKLLCFPSESAEDCRENYRTLLIIFHNSSGSMYWQV